MASIPILKRKVVQGAVSFESKIYRNQRLRGVEGMDVDLQVDGRRITIYNPVGKYVCGFDRQGVLELGRND